MLTGGVDLETRRQRIDPEARRLRPTNGDGSTRIDMVVASGDRVAGWNGFCHKLTAAVAAHR
jgi:hypothetical protein